MSLSAMFPSPRSLPTASLSLHPNFRFKMDASHWRKIGSPYAWAQDLSGLKFLTPYSEDGCHLSASAIVKRFRKVTQSRMGLVRQLSALGTLALSH